MQKRGATAVPILTRPFENVLDRILSYYKTSERLPFIAVEHPIQNVGPAELADRARQIVAAAVRMLDSSG